MTDAATHPSSRRLGRGLSALLGGSAPAHEELDRPVASELCEVPVQAITRNPFQPRKQFDPESLNELAASVREHGVLQPLLVREVDNGFQLVAGERRWLAAQRAGLKTVPCRVVDVIDKTACEFALEENLKRKDLNDLEKAQAFRDYLDHFECSIEELSKQLSMNRSTVSNILRLLDLCDPVKHALHAGRITAGHARAILPLEEAAQLELCSRIQAEQMSVRQVETAVRAILKPESVPTGPEQAAPESTGPALEAEVAVSSQDEQVAPQAEEGAVETVTAEAASTEDGSSEATIPISEGDAARTNHVASLEAQLRDMLGVPVQIKQNGKESGQIVIPFSSHDEFDRTLRTIRRAAA